MVVDELFGAASGVAFAQVLGTAWAAARQLSLLALKLAVILRTSDPMFAYFVVISLQLLASAAGVA